MLMRAITAIDNVNVRWKMICEESGDSCRGVTDDYCVKLHRFKHAHRVEQRLSLRQATGGGRKGHRVGAKTLLSQLKADPRTSGVLEEKIGNRSPLKQSRSRKLVRCIEEFVISIGSVEQVDDHI